MNTPAPRFLTSEIWERTWGEEQLLVHTDLYTLKFLKYKAGNRGGLQKHQVKNEASYVLEGKMLFEYVDEDGVIQKKELGPGEAVHIVPGLIHRETAITDVTVIEVSNPVFNDRVRCEEQFGETIPEGTLPTTSFEEIEVGYPRRPYTPGEKI